MCSAGRKAKERQGRANMQKSAERDAECHDTRCAPEPQNQPRQRKRAMNTSCAAAANAENAQPIFREQRRYAMPFIRRIV